MKYYYTDAQNKPTGPVELEQLKQLHAQGALRPETSVIPEGASQWTTYGALLASLAPAPAAAAPAPTPSPAPKPTPATAAATATAPETAQPAPAAAQPAPAPKPAAPAGPRVGIVEQVTKLLASLVDVILRTMRSILTEKLLRSILTFFANWGYLVVLAGAALALVQSVVGGIRGGSFAAFVSSLGTGVAVAGAVAVLQYVAFRFFSANEALVKSNPSRVGSAAFLDCLALILLTGSFASVVGGVFGSIAVVSIKPLIPGLISAVILLFCAGIALNPALCNVQIEESSAGEEAIGLASFFGKVSLVVQPALFFLLALGGTLAIIAAFFNASASDAIATALRAVPVANLFASAGGAALLVVACLLPVIYYLGFLILYLQLDLFRAILGMPRQLDRLGRK